MSSDEERGHGGGPPPGVTLPGQPPQSRREGSRWRRRRPAPAAARPLILFSLLTSVAFVAILSVVFLPRILTPQEAIPQFFLDPPAVGGSETTVTVADATGPRTFTILRVTLDDTDPGGTARRVVNATLDGPGLGPVTVRDMNGNGQLDGGDGFVVATATGHQYVLSIVYTLSGAVVAEARFP